VTTPQHNEPNTVAASQSARRFFSRDTVGLSNRQLARRYLLSAISAAVFTPLLFYLHFGELSWFAIGFTVFLVLLCLLVALGAYFQDRTDYDTRVAGTEGVGDRVGAFWAVACAFGPLLGWFITAFTPSENSWWWQYAARILFGVALPIVTMLPLLRYVRGKAAMVGLPLLLGITALPISSCWWTIGDLHDGAHSAKVSISRDISTAEWVCSLTGPQYNLPCDAARNFKVAGDFQVTWLEHTSRVIGVRKL